eukprot:3455441-Rhodomonas_salina.5
MFIPTVAPLCPWHSFAGRSLDTASHPAPLYPGKHSQVPCRHMPQTHPAAHGTIASDADAVSGSSNGSPCSHAVTASILGAGL